MRRCELALLGSVDAARDREAGLLGTKRETREREEGDVGVVEGGNRWHDAVVCPGTTMGWHSTPAVSPVPVAPQADFHASHTHAVMRIF